jgi:SAM-dependent methyltransferase
MTLTSVFCEIMPMEKNIDHIFALLAGDLDLIEPRLRQWSRQYFLNHQKRYRSDLQIIQQYYCDGEILEIGSLPCHITYCLKKLNLPVVGVDIEPGRADDFLNKHGLTVKKCDIEKEQMPFSDDKFNMVLFNEVFEHLRIDPIATLKEVHRVLSPGGIIILSTPNLCALDKRWQLFCGRGYDDPYSEFEKLHLLGHMGHVREYTTSQVRKFLCNTGFEVVAVEYRIYHPLRRRILQFLQDVCMLIVPRWRPYQVFVARKQPL